MSADHPSGMANALWLAPEQITTAHREAWDALAAVAAEPNPFFEAPFVTAALAHLHHRRVRLLAIADGDEWIGFMPVQSGLRWRRVPASVRGPWSHDYAYLGTPLVARGREREAVAGLLEALRPRGGMIAFELLDEDGPVNRAIDAALADARLQPVLWDRHARAALDRRPENDYVATTLKSRRRRELRRQRAKLVEELGADVTTVDRAGDPAAIEAFLALEASGWKGRAGTALRSAEHDGFFRALCTAYAAIGRLQLLSLETAERSVAMKCNVIAQDQVFCLKIAHDEMLARFSPGVQLEVDNVDAFHDRPELRTMDSCADYDNEMINRLWPDRKHLVTHLVAREGLMGTAARNEAEVAAAIRRRMKERSSA